MPHKLLAPILIEFERALVGVGRDSIDTRVSLYSLKGEDCNCAFVGIGYQQKPPAIWQQRELASLK